MHLATTLVLFGIGIVIYVMVTPYREISLIRHGNVAAAISLSGQILALAIPLAAMMANSVSFSDIALWGVVTLVLQLITFLVVATVIRHLPASIERGEVVPALVLACAQIATGLLIAAAMSG
jgi:putative membrane protein